MKFATMRAARAPPLAITLGALALMVALALRTPLDHDEGQYIAATHLVARGLMPYRDFPYLQTPLQPLLFAPVAFLVPGWLLIASRLVNSALAALAIWLIGRTAEAMAKDPKAGVFAMLLMLGCDPVLYAGSVARNDALPLFLLALALSQAFAAPVAWSGRRGFFIGLFAAAAASAKLSYAFPAAAIVGQSIWLARDRSRRGPAAALLLGSLAGLLPTIVLFAAAPQQFLFQVYRYGVDAVPAWAELKGGSWQLSVPVRIAQWSWNALQGPLLAMLAIGIVAQWRRRAGLNFQLRPISLGIVVAATALATILPAPSLRQYLVPLAAPLVLWFVALAWHLLTSRQWSLQGPSSRFWLALTVFLGFQQSARVLLLSSVEESPLRVEREAHAIGDLARKAGVRSIGTLEPVHVIDSGVDLDPRFATGQFLFRAGNLSDCANSQLCPVTFATMDRLDRNPPGALLTGTQHKHPGFIPGGLDGALDSWALSAHFRPVALNRRNLLWLGPPVPADRVAALSPAPTLPRGI